MSSQTPASKSAMAKMSPRTWIAIILTLVAVLIIAVNWDPTNISFLVGTVRMPLAIALAISFLGGMAAGAVLLRRRQS